jgi:hypothetical protein
LLWFFIYCFVVIAVLVHDVVDVTVVIVVVGINDFAIATVSMVVSIRQS